MAFPRTFLQSVCPRGQSIALVSFVAILFTSSHISIYKNVQFLLLSVCQNLTLVNLINPIL